MIIDDLVFPPPPQGHTILRSGKWERRLTRTDNEFSKFRTNGVATLCLQFSSVYSLGHCSVGLWRL
jgi:hypothetical protein